MLVRSSHRQRIVAVTAAAALAGAGMITLGVGIAQAAPSTTVGITAVSPHYVPAGKASQVITLTGKGFDQSTMTGVVLSGAGACTTDPQYIVVTPTTLVLKTADTDCSVGASTITITDSSGTAVNPVGAATALNFTAAPTLLATDSTHNSVTTDNTAGLAFADQVLSAPVTGGTAIRVLAGSVPFINPTDAPLKASLNGVALTAITMPVGGAYFTGKLGAHAAAAGSLTVTSGNATATFITTDINDFAYAGNTMSVLPVSGPANGGTVITITGIGFSSSSTVTVGGVSATAVAATGTTKLVATVPQLASGASDGPAVVTVTTGGVSPVFSVTSVFTYLSS
jgi:hypothetical protein